MNDNSNLQEAFNFNNLFSDYINLPEMQLLINHWDVILIIGAILYIGYVTYMYRQYK